MKTLADIKLKVCGMRDPKNITELADLTPDFIGFIFYDRSPRYMREVLNERDLAAIPDSSKKVGVFVNESLEVVRATAEKYGLDLLQLHGSESPEYCEECRKTIPVIKAFPMSDGFDFQLLDQYEHAVDYFLFDTKSNKHGGSGKQFDWNMLERYTLKTPYFLSGGIGEDDVEKILKSGIPNCYAIDINSKVEVEPGLKDIHKIRLFKERLKEGVKI